MRALACPLALAAFAFAATVAETPAAAQLFGSNGGPLCSVLSIGCPARPGATAAAATPAPNTASDEDEDNASPFRPTRTGGPVGGGRGQE